MQSGAGNEVGTKIYKDQNGDILIHGLAIGNNCTVGDSTFNAQGVGDTYIAEFSGTDLSFSWITIISGEGWDTDGNIVFDTGGNIILAAAFEDTVSFGNNIGVSGSSGDDILLAKFSADGEIIWAKSAGGQGQDKGTGVSLDSDNNIYITGFFTDNFTIGGNSTPIFGSGKETFLAKYTADGSFVWVNTDGGDNNDYSYSVTVYENKPIITGVFNGEANFGSTENPVVLTSASNDNDVFVASYLSNGELDNAMSFEGSGDDEGRLIRLINNNELIISGRLTDTLTFGAGVNSDTLIETGAFYTDAFFSKFIITPNLTGQPSNTTICEGNSSSFSVSLDGSHTFQWQINEGSGFEDISNDATYSNSTTENLSIANAPLTINSFEYKCIINGSNYIIESDIVTITVDELIEANAGIDISLENVNYTQLDATIPNNGTGTWSVVTGSGTFSDINQANCIVTGLTEGENMLQWKVTNGECESIDEVRVDISLGIDKLRELGINIFPNPSSGIININTQEQLFINIYNQQGVLIKSMQINKNKTIDLTGFSKGIYMVVIRTRNNETLKKKVILK